MEIIFFIFLAAAIIQLFFYLFFFLRLAIYKIPNPPVVEPVPVSVIICARNEEANLRKNLSFVLEQNYPEFEVVVVNDNSDDNTEMLLSELKNKYHHLNIVAIASDTRWLKGKRFALGLGIKSAKYDWVLLTDADCRPVGAGWIRTMQQHFTHQTEIILGYSPYEKGPGFLNKCIRYDAFYTALQYLSFALAGLPYMGVGRNLAYRKELFYRHRGFSPEQKQLLSGDDDLFVNKIADARNTAIVLDEKSWVDSGPKKSWGSWLLQKRRHLSTGIYYKAKHQFLLGILSFSQVAWYTSLLVLICFQFNLMWLAGIFLFRFFIQGCILYKSMQRLKVADLWIFYPFLDFLYYVFYLILAPAFLFKKTTQWK